MVFRPLKRGLNANAPSAVISMRRPLPRLQGTPKAPKNEEAGRRSEEWKDFLKPYCPLDPEPGLGGILSVGLLQTIASSFLDKMQCS